jgi:hypothetical protein
MKKQLAISSVAGIAIALLALLSLRGSAAEAATSELMPDPETATSEPVSDPEAATSGLTLDPETGLPAGSLVFHVEDHTCIALPNHELECFCPCSSGMCTAQVEFVPLLSSPAVTSVAPVTSTGSTIRDNLMPVPRWEQTPGSEETPELRPERGEESGRDGSKGNNGVGNGEDPQPPGNPPINDGPGTSPGNPGNKGGGNNRGNKKD